MILSYNTNLQLILETTETGFQDTHIQKVDGNLDGVEALVVTGDEIVITLATAQFSKERQQAEMNLVYKDVSTPMTAVTVNKTRSTYTVTAPELVAELTAAVDADTGDVNLDIGVNVELPNLSLPLGDIPVVGGTLTAEKWTAANIKLGATQTKYIKFTRANNELELTFTAKSLSIGSTADTVLVEFLLPTIDTDGTLLEQLLTADATKDVHGHYVAKVSSPEFGKFLTHQEKYGAKYGFKATATVTRGFVPPKALGDIHVQLEGTSNRASWTRDGKGIMTSGDIRDQLLSITAVKDYGITILLKDVDILTTMGTINVSIQQSAEIELSIGNVSGGVGANLEEPHLAELLLDGATKDYPVGLDMTIALEARPEPKPFNPDIIPDVCKDVDDMAQHFKLLLWKYIGAMYPTVTNDRYAIQANQTYLLQTLDHLLGCKEENFIPVYDGLRALFAEYRTTVFDESMILRGLDTLGKQHFPAINRLSALVNILRVDFDAPNRNVFLAMVDLGKLEEDFYFRTQQAENLRYYYSK